MFTMMVVAAAPNSPISLQVSSFGIGGSHIPSSCAICKAQCTFPRFGFMVLGSRLQKASTSTLLASNIISLALYHLKSPSPSLPCWIIHVPAIHTTCNMKSNCICNFCKVAQTRICVWLFPGSKHLPQFDCPCIQKLHNHLTSPPERPLAWHSPGSTAPCNLRKLPLFDRTTLQAYITLHLQSQYTTQIRWLMRRGKHTESIHS
jgi:hypothetical protein